MLSAIRLMQMLFKFPHHLFRFSNVEMCRASVRDVWREEILWVSNREKQFGLEVRSLARLTGPANSWLPPPGWLRAQGILWVRNVDAAAESHRAPNLSDVSSGRSDAAC